MALFETPTVHFHRMNGRLNPIMRAVLPVLMGMSGEELVVSIEGLGTITLTPEETERLRKVLEEKKDKA